MLPNTPKSKMLTPVTYDASKTGYTYEQLWEESENNCLQYMNHPLCVDYYAYLYEHQDPHQNWPSHDPSNYLKVKT